MVTIAFCNHKGGTGKTTTAINVAAALGLCGFQTLVIDLDPQGYLSRMLGMKEPDHAASSGALFQHDIDPRGIEKVAYPGFDVLPASGQLTRQMRKLTSPADVLWVREALQQGTEHDVVILDTAAAVTVYSLNALVASHYVFIPVIPEYQPVVGAEQTYQSVTTVSAKLNPKMHPPCFLLTQVDARKRSHHQYRELLRSRYGEQVLRPMVRTSASLAASCKEGMTVFRRDPYSRGARDYANVTDEIIRLVGLKPREA